MENKRNVIIESEISFEDNIYLFSLVMAICNVDIKYILWNDDDISPNTKEHVERVFAYELYHQWSKICERCPLLNGLMINAELPKQIIYKDNENNYFPDLVFHGGQNDLINNIIVVEIKRSCSSSIDAYKDDLKKLKKFSSDFTKKDDQNNNIKVTGFKYVIFIIEGRNALENYDFFLKEIGLDDNVSGVIIMSYNGKGLKMSQLG